MVHMTIHIEPGHGHHELTHPPSLTTEQRR